MACCWVLPLGLALAAPGCRGGPSPPSSTKETVQQSYRWHCLGCHGAKGEGAWGPNIKHLHRSVDEISAVIAKGGDKMPAFGGHLSPEQIRVLSEYVKTFP